MKIYQDGTVEVQSESDLALLERWQARQKGENGVRATGAKPQPEPRVESSAAQPSRAEDWKQRLKSDNQRKLVDLLLSRPEGLSDSELREELGFDTNAQIAGVLCGVIRHAKAAGFKKGGPIKKDGIRNGDGSRHYRYSLPREVRAVLSD